MLPILFAFFFIPTGSPFSYIRSNVYFCFCNRRRLKRSNDSRILGRMAVELFLRSYPSLVLEVEVPFYRP